RTSARLPVRNRCSMPSGSGSGGAGRAAAAELPRPKPGQVRQAVAIGAGHPGMAAQLLHQHGGADVGARHGLLADLAEAETAVEEQGRVVAALQEHLAAQQRPAHFGEALHVGVEGPAAAAAAAGPGDDDAVDVQETLVALAEPEEIRALVRGVLAEGGQEPGDVAVLFGDPEVFGVVPEKP